MPTRPWTELQVKSWADLQERFAKQGKLPPIAIDFLYRGQADCERDLVPSLLRIANLPPDSADAAIKLERVAASRFASEASLHIAESYLPRGSKNILGWWNLMQSHGAPTRVLDWTRSPYVAAYFAVAEHPDKAGTVWSFKAPALLDYLRTEHGIRSDDPPDESQEYWKKDPSPIVFVGTGLRMGERMVAQQGAYTVCKYILGDQTELIANACASHMVSDPLVKFIIPARLKEEILSNLIRMNIRASSMFPGADGLARSVKEDLILGSRFAIYLRDKLDPG